ncbi:MAG: oligogalacturonate lyase family protein [Pseudomonadota bacterium]
MKFAAALLFALVAIATPAAAQAPGEWIDPTTGHRIVRITAEPGASKLYFTQQVFTPQGDKMIITTAAGIAAVDLKTWKIAPVVTAQSLRLLFVGRKTRTAYYSMRGDARANGAGASADGARGGFEVWAADIDTGATRKIAYVAGGQIDSINSDETLLLGQVTERAMPLQPGAGARDPRTDQAAYAANGPDGKPLTFAEAKEVRLNERQEARIPMEIFTIDTRTGARKKVYGSTDWLNHLQFSPTDPGLIMFCHEGPWHKVDRIWTIRSDGSGLTKVHTRTMNMEIAGHEFWSPDGKTIWYDLQTPRGEVFWLASYEVATGRRQRYKVDRDQWSVHFNISPDQTLFSGDGGDSEMVAHAKDGKWLYLFRPRAIPDVAGIHAPDSESLISPGTLESERLMNLSRHDYRLEPNAHFTPDGKWLVIRSNIEGPQGGIYAVEIAPARAQ